MKRNIYSYITAFFLMAGVVLACITGCRKDTGNYTYTRIDSVAISGIDDSYQVSLGTTTAIHPVLTYESGKNVHDSDFTYEWVYYTDAVIGGNRTTLHTGRNLDTILPLRIGTYNFYYTIKQKTTGITWQKRFNVAITGTFKKYGWFVLNDIAGQARVDYYEDNPAAFNTFPVVYRNLTSLIKDDNTGEAFPLSGKPLSITASINRDVINSTGTIYWLYINTDKATLKVNLTNGFTWDKTKYLFANETAFGEPARMDYIEGGSSANGAYGFYDGNLYMYYHSIALYGAPMNRVAGGTPFKIAPYLAFPYNTYLHAMFYDTDNKRFVRTMYTLATATTITTAGQAFDLANVGKDMVWMGYTRLSNGQVIAILKDNNKYFLARIGFVTTTTTPTITAVSMTEVTDKITGIAQADRFVIDQQYGYLFYTVGNKLYQYDMDNQVAKLAKDYGSRKISMLKVNKLTIFPAGSSNFNVLINRLEAPGYAIIVGSYDEKSPDNSGTIDFLKAPALMGNLTTYFSPFTGLGKVVDVKYNEPN